MHETVALPHTGSITFSVITDQWYEYASLISFTSNYLSFITTNILHITQCSHWDLLVVLMKTVVWTNVYILIIFNKVFLTKRQSVRSEFNTFDAKWWDHLCCTQLCQCLVNLKPYKYEIFYLICHVFVVTDTSFGLFWHCLWPWYLKWGPGVPSIKGNTLFSL